MTVWEQLPLYLSGGEENFFGGHKKRRAMGEHKMTHVSHYDSLIGTRDEIRGLLEMLRGTAKIGF